MSRPKTNAQKTFLGENLVNLICDYVRIPKVRLVMSTENLQRAVLDYSQDGRQIVENVRLFIKSLTWQLSNNIRS